MILVQWLLDSGRQNKIKSQAADLGNKIIQEESWLNLTMRPEWHFNLIVASNLNLKLHLNFS
jgi:hypothetical protein